MNDLQPKPWLELLADDFVSTIKRLKPETVPAEGLSVRTWPDSKHHLFTDSDAESHFQHIASWLSQHWIKDST